MLPELTPASARALEAAQHLARRHGTADVRPAHLLVGLLEEEEGGAAQLLARAGVTAAAVRELLGRPPPEAVPHPAEAPLPLHPRTRELLREARDVARELFGETAVTSESLLLALLREEQDLARALAPLGLDPTRLEAECEGRRLPPLEMDEPLRLTDPVEVIDTARILDAGANRAREALRVVEDYCRFVLDDALLSGELKRLRHDLAEALADVSRSTLLEARETQQDVGTRLHTAREGQRHSLLEVVQANLKRLQEALRSLEEFGKLRAPELGAAIEQFRYRSYTLERALLLGTTARERLTSARLYVLVSGSQCAAALDWTIQEAAAGGADVIQLREKGLSDRELLQRARQVRRWTRRAGVLFVLNDRPDLARLVEADGVHLGQDDLPVKEARRILGPDALIGVSTHDLEQVRRAVLDGAAYLGVGPTFPSSTKAFAEFPGLEFVRQALAETSLPAFVLGGVNLQTIDAAVAAGARRVAVSAAICGAEDPRQAARALRQRLEA